MSDNEGSEEKILNEDQGSNDEPNSSSEESDASDEGTCTYYYRLECQDLQFISMVDHKAVGGLHLETVLAISAVYLREAIPMTAHLVPPIHW